MAWGALWLVAVGVGRHGHLRVWTVVVIDSKTGDRELDASGGTEDEESCIADVNRTTIGIVIAVYLVERARVISNNQSKFGKTHHYGHFQVRFTKDRAGQHTYLRPSPQPTRLRPCTRRHD